MSSNPGPGGGWAYVLTHGDETQEETGEEGIEQDTVSPRMEVYSALRNRVMPSSSNVGMTLFLSAEYRGSRRAGRRPAPRASIAGRDRAPRACRRRGPAGRRRPPTPARRAASRTWRAARGARACAAARSAAATPPYSGAGRHPAPRARAEGSGVGLVGPPASTA